MTRAEYERARAIVEFAKNPGNTFSFAFYKDKRVRESLKAEFHDKCAYCEMRSAGAPKDIEHFRPKSEVDTGSGPRRPGYFWLAAEWTNLLLSCQRCNRAEAHEVGIAGGKKVVLGKAIQFPLRDGRKRVKAPPPAGSGTDPEEPYRLLLHPCVDDPARHLVFRDDGLVAARKAGGIESDMAVASIQVYGLQRKELVEDRATVASDVVRILDGIERSAEVHRLAAAANHDAIRAQVRDEISDGLAALRAKLEPRQPHLAVVRSTIRRRARGMAAAKEYGIDLLESVRISEQRTAG